MKKSTKERGFWLIKNAITYILLLIFRITYGAYLILFYRIKMIKQKDFKLKGPCLLLANHLNTFDGVYIQALVSKPIRFVIGDGIFKNKYLRALMSLVEFIPKKKFVSDTRAIKRILRVIKNCGIVGLFPEGERSWDGKAIEMTSATFRLVKMLNVPVVTAVIKGAYFTEPRWSESKRRGKIEIEFKTLLSTQALKTMSVEEIERVITKELDHNEFEWQANKKFPFKGKNLAEGFERMIYTCPKCGSLDSFFTSGDSITCSVCKLQYDLDEYGFIHSDKGYLPGESVVEINRWQFEQLKIKYSNLKENDIYMSNEGAELLSSPNVETPFKKADGGDIRIAKGVLAVGDTYFNLSDIYGVTVNLKSHLSFRHKALDYRVSFKDKNISVYKWYKVLKIFLGNMKEEY